MAALLAALLVCVGVAGVADTQPACPCGSTVNCSPNGCADCSKCICSITVVVEKAPDGQPDSNWTAMTASRTLVIYATSNGGLTLATLSSGATYWVGDQYSATGMVQVGYEMADGEITKVGWCYKADIPGMTQSTVEVPKSENPYNAFNKDTAETIYNAGNGETIQIHTDTWASFPSSVMEAIAARRDITVELTYKYEGTWYTTIIPAGAEVPVEVPYAGFYGYLGGLYGRTEVE